MEDIKNHFFGIIVEKINQLVHMKKAANPEAAAAAAEINSLKNEQ